MRRYLYSIGLLMLVGVSVQAQEYDDIYYNPKKDTKSVSSSKQSNRQSNYIKDFSSIDEDVYNRRGQYYESPIDTIGSAAENNEDFVYTQKIQKFYNPTIVVENAGVLLDVLDNSYGNIEIVYDGGLPYFNSIYGWPGYFNYSSWRWNVGYGPSWAYSPLWGWEYWPSWSIGPSWAWGPGWGWNYGPSWAWAPAWGFGPSWGWGPSWSWGPSWGHPYYADWRPNGRQPNRPGGNWANNTRPGGNIGGGNRPGAHATNGSMANVNTSRNYHRTPSSNYYGNVANRVNSSSSSSYKLGNDGHRIYTSSSNNGVSSSTSSGYHRSSSSSVNSGKSSSNSSYSNRSTSSHSSSYSSGRSSSSRSSGGSYGGGRSSSGSGRGRR